MGLFNLFKKNTPPKTETKAEIITDIGGFSPWSGDSYSSDIYRGAIDAIARNFAKVKGSHVVTYDDTKKTPGDQQINQILQVSPNPYMSAYDLWYKMVTHLYLYNNSFAYLQKTDQGQLLGIYPINARHVDFLADPTGDLFLKFLFSNGKDYILPYADIVHLRRHFNENDLLGDPNNAIMGTLELAHNQDEGMTNSIQSSANIRGILQFTGQLAGPKLKEKKEEFINDYMGVSNNGGIAMLDTTMEYTPINSTPVNIDDAQIKAIKTKIYDYLGISESIVNSSYTEDEWAATYESVIEPIATQLSLEMTCKVFTKKEQSFGNSILFESGRLQFSSNATKVNLIKELLPMGILSLNDAREILNLPSIEGGEKRLTSLNYVNADKADQYQLQEDKTQ